MGDIKIGEIYNYFDDGKITPQRLCKVEIINIISKNEISKEIYELWKEESQSCDWIYNSNTDFFIEGDLLLNLSGSSKEKIYFVRSKNNTWFSLGWWAGYLDYDYSLTKIYNERAEKYNWDKI